MSSAAPVTNVGEIFQQRRGGRRGRLLWEREGGILAFPPSATSLTNVGWHWVRRIGYEEGAAGKELEKLQGQGDGRGRL